MLYDMIETNNFFSPPIFLQNLQGLTGTPLVAGSPIRHESTVQGNPVEVQTYQPPWKALSEFALQSDLDQPAFQQLVCVFRTDVQRCDLSIYQSIYLSIFKFVHIFSK